MIGVLLFFGLIVFVLFLIGTAPPRSHGRRLHTQREDDMHNQIQQAMNWQPEMGHQRKDGKWYNDEGQELKSYTLEEFMELYGRKDRNDT